MSNRTNEATPSTAPVASKHLLLLGRWHGVTLDQERALLHSIQQAGPGHLVFVITGADQSGTKRHPLALSERLEIVHTLGRQLARPYDVVPITDIADSTVWIEHVRRSVADNSNGKFRLDPSNTEIIGANPDVSEAFTQAGYAVHVASFSGHMPADIFSAIRSGKDWKALASRGTIEVYEAHGLAQRIDNIFADVLLTDDGELSSGRDFHVYIAGMDASMGVKIEDICPWVVPGFIVDKGCGSGTLLKHLSALFPTSQIVGVDLSRELLHVAESQHYPHNNVSVVKGNIIHQRFPAGSVSTSIFSSVVHEIYSYNQYDREQVRLALRNTRTELHLGGHAIIRDGIAPRQRRVWMWCDARTEELFRRFAHDFKKGSPTPGIRFVEHVIDGQRWYELGLHEANEFLSKKDYLENWDIEVKEEFGVFRIDQWKRELEKQRYRVVHAHSYVNPWIEANRYNGRVRLHANSSGKPGRQLRFPDTTAVLVGEAA